MAGTDPREPGLTPEKWQSMGRNVAFGGGAFALVVLVILLATGTSLSNALLSVGVFAAIAAGIGLVIWKQEGRARWTLLAINGGIALLMIILSQIVPEEAS